ncbi:MAG: site-specific integrase [Candidatus Gastranaerophilales bacterium]|nr:site-specific integrase [Candidatus Gastranaerophilales bacterium]
MKNLVEPIKSKKEIEMIEQYLEHVSTRNRIIFTLGINTGLRISDILGLNVEDVDGKNYVELKEKKTGKYKRFPLNMKLQKLIKSYLEERSKIYSFENEVPLFVGKKHKRLDRSQVYRFLNKACKELKIDINAGTHTMRKTFGYFFYKQNNNLALLQKILNHSSPSVTLRYIGITQDEIDISYSGFEL